MISSTSLDLPEHREQVMNACIRMGMFPVMMEHLTASDVNASTKSLAMVDRADIFIGVLAFRYGYVPDSNNPERISVTEMEYNRAVERGIPRLIFFMDKLHPITAADMDEDTTDAVEAARRPKSRSTRMTSFMRVKWSTTPRTSESGFAQRRKEPPRRKRTQSTAGSAASMSGVQF
jgi:hypothetical protein